MAKAPSPGDRLKMEEALGREHCKAIAAQCRALGIPLDRWHLVQAVAASWEALAVTLLADRLQVEEGIARKPAEEAASIRLGLNPDTMRSRLRRWFEEAYTRAA